MRAASESIELSGATGLEEELVMFVTSDLAGMTRGRSFPARDLSKRMRVGVGWVPANQAIDAFGDMAPDNPFGPMGDLRLFPVGDEIAVPFEGASAAPMAAVAMANESFDAGVAKTRAPGEGAAELVQPTVRSEFADTALWVASLETDKEGLANVELKMPENLTTWKIRAWSMGDGTRVGEASAEVVTRKNLIVRMQAPRFFVETDEVVLSATWPAATLLRSRMCATICA